MKNSVLYDTIITRENLNEKKVNLKTKTVEVVIGKKFEMYKKYIWINDNK